MGNVALGGSKRQSYSPGEAVGTGQTAAVPGNGNVKPAGANGQVEGVKDGATDQRDVIVADDNSSITPSSSVPATPTTSSPGSPLSPTEKKSKRKVPRFVFSLRRTGSGKRSRKPRTEANGVRPVSYPVASASTGGSGSTPDKGRPQSLLFEEIAIPEDDGKIETVSLSSNDDNIEKDRRKDSGETPSSPKSPSPKTSSSKKEKKKEGSQKKKNSKKKKDKEAKSKAEKQKKGTKDKEDTSPGQEAARETQTAVEERVMAAVVSIEESVPTRQPKQDQATAEEVIVPAVAQTEETQPAEAPESKNLSVQEVITVEVAQPNQQTPARPVEETAGGRTGESGVSSEAAELKSPERDLAEISQTECESQMKQEEETQENEEQTQQEENTENKQQDTPEEDKAEEVKQEREKAEELNKIIAGATTSVEESKGDHTAVKETVEDPVEMVIQPSVAAVASAEIKTDDNTPEKGQTGLTTDLVNAVHVLEADMKSEQQDVSDVVPASETVFEGATAEESKVDLKPEISLHATADPGGEANNANEQPAENVDTGSAHAAAIAVKRADSSEKPDDGFDVRDITAPIVVSVEAAEPASQEAERTPGSQDQDDVPENTTSRTNDMAVVVEDVVTKTISVEAEAAPQASFSRSTGESAQEETQAPVQPPVLTENSNQTPQSEINDTAEDVVEDVLTKTVSVEAEADLQASSSRSTAELQSEKERQVAAVSKPVVEAVAAGYVRVVEMPPAVQGDSQPPGDNPAPLSPSQIKALEKELKAAKKREEKEKAKKEKEDKKRQKEMKRLEAKEKKQKEKEDRERKARELKEKEKAVGSVNTEIKPEDVVQDVMGTSDIKGAESAPSSPTTPEIKPEQQGASFAGITDYAPALSVNTEMKQEEINVTEVNAGGMKQQPDMQTSWHAEGSDKPAPSVRSDDTKSSQSNVEPVNIKLLPDNQDSELPSPTPKEPELPSPTPKEPELPVPTSKEPELPSPTPKEPELPSPTSKEPELPSPTPKEPELPSPTPKEPELPSPTPKEPELPSPTPKEPELPSPTPKEPELPSPIKESRHSSSSACSSSSESAASYRLSPATPDSTFGDFSKSPDTSVAVDSDPASPTSPDTSETSRTGALKKIELGSRLRTAILRKSSGGAENEEKRVNLTQPRFVQTTQLTPPPRKQRPRRPLEQVWSPLGDYASNRARATTSPGQKETRAVVEDTVIASKTSNSESAPAKPSVSQTEDRADTSKSQGKEPDPVQPQAAVTASLDNSTSSTAPPKKEAPDREACSKGTLDGEGEELMTMSTAALIESVPQPSTLQPSTDSAEGNQESSQQSVRQTKETAVFAFETASFVSTSGNADNSQGIEVDKRIKTDNDGEYTVMYGMRCPGSRVSIHSDPSSPTIVSVASIILSGQTDTPDSLPPSDPPHQPVELQTALSGIKAQETEAEEVKEEAERNAGTEETITVPQKSVVPSLQTMAAGLVSQANEDAQLEVVKLISEDKAVDKDDLTDGVADKIVSEDDVSEDKGDTRVEDIDNTDDASFDETDLRRTRCIASEQPSTGTVQHNVYCGMEGLRDNVEATACDGSVTLLNMKCTNSSSGEQKDVQVVEVVHNDEDSAKNTHDDDVTVAVQPVVSINCSPLAESQSSDSADGNVLVSDTHTEGASVNISDSSQIENSAECHSKVLDLEVESESSCPQEGIKTVTALQTSVEILSQPTVPVTDEEEERFQNKKHGTSCVLIPEELAAELKLNVTAESKEQPEDSELTSSMDSAVKMEVESCIVEPSEDSESKVSPENDATPSVEDTSKTDCTELQSFNVPDHGIAVPVDGNEAAVQKEEPHLNTETAAQSVNTPEKESGESSLDKQCLEAVSDQLEEHHKEDSDGALAVEKCAESQPGTTEQGSDVSENDTSDQTAESRTEQCINTAIVAAPVSTDDTTPPPDCGQPLDSDGRPQEVSDQQVGQETEEGVVQVSVQCNGFHGSEANSSDTIDAYLRLQDGTARVHETSGVERPQGSDVADSRSAESSEGAEKAGARAASSTSQQEDDLSSADATSSSP